MSSSRNCLPVSASLLLAAALAASPAAAEVLAGVDSLAALGLESLKGRRVGLITNHTGRTRAGVSTAEVLARSTGLRLAALFSPEHGFAGDIEDAAVSSGTVTLKDGVLTG